MGVVSNTMNSVDTFLNTYVQGVFTTVAGPLQVALASAGVLSLILLVLNNIFQFTTINLREYLIWVLRFAIIYAFATIWANFALIYDLFTNVPAEYVGVLMQTVQYTSPDTGVFDPGRVTDIYSAIDEFGNGVINVAHKMFDQLGWKPSTWKYLLMGIAFLFIGFVFLAASVIIILISKVGFALALSLAPLAISFLLFPQTRGYFQSWLNFATGFAIVPLLTGGIMAIVISIGVQTLPIPAPKKKTSFWDALAAPFKAVGELFGFGGGGGDNGIFSAYFAFLLIACAAMFLMFQIPTMASSLAQTSVAGAGAGALFAAKSMAGRAISSTFAKVAAPISAARNFNYARNMARQSGQGQISSIGSALSAMRVGSQVRQQRLQNSIPALKGPGGNTPKALPAPAKPGTSGSGSAKPLTEEMRKNFNR